MMQKQGKLYKMPRQTERTPLIQQVPVAEHHERYPHHTVGPSIGCAPRMFQLTLRSCGDTVQSA